VVAVAFVGINLLPGSGVGPGAQPSPSPTAEPTATPLPTSTAVAGLPEGRFDFEDNRLAMTVTIPASGWTFDGEFTALGKGKEVANLPEATVLFWSFLVGTRFYVYGDPCRSTSTKPDTSVTTAAEIATGLSTQTSRDASEPADAGQIDELWILDVDGAVTIIDAMYRSDTPPALVEEMRAMVESTTFDTP
jgi:hypothetical protein